MAKSRIKVPKRVAGVKIPKTVRKGPVMEFVNSSAGRLLIAEALTAAIGVFAYKQSKTDSATGKALRKAGERAGEVQDALADNTARLSYAFSEGVRAFRMALTEPGAIIEQAATVENADSAADAGKKKGRKWSPPEAAAPH